MSIEISIIIPIYNAGEYLRAALESVARQSFGDWECICVNDGSTDGSLDVIREFIERDSRFVLLDKPNGGVSEARNAGLDIARGRYITFLDHDDLLAEHSLEVYVGLIEQYGTDMVRTAYRQIETDYALPETSERPQYYDIQYYGNVLGGLNAVIAQPAIQKWYYIWNCCVRRETLMGIRFDNRLRRGGGEDLLFMALVWGAIRNFVQSSYVTTLHRTNPTSITSTYNLFREGTNVSIPAIKAIYDADPSPMNRYFYRYMLLGCYHETMRVPLRRMNRRQIREGRKILAQLVKEGTFDVTQLEKIRQIEIQLFLKGWIVASYLLSLVMWGVYTVAGLAYRFGLRKRKISGQ